MDVRQVIRRVRRLRTEVIRPGNVGNGRFCFLNGRQMLAKRSAVVVQIRPLKPGVALRTQSPVILVPHKCELVRALILKGRHVNIVSDARSKRSGGSGGSTYVVRCVLGASPEPADSLTGVWSLIRGFRGLSTVNPCVPE